MSRLCVRMVVSGAVFATLVAAIPAYADGPFDEIQMWQEPDGSITYFKITRPNPTVQSRTYESVLIPGNSYIEVQAGGCVQTGGHGKTWKRYVNPIGPNSNKYYHGLVQIPGAIYTPTRFADLQTLSDGWSAQSHIWNSVFLTLGYEDNNYDDNGYWGWDPGTGNQCVGEPDAYVLLRYSSRPFY